MLPSAFCAHIHSGALVLAVGAAADAAVAKGRGFSAARRRSASFEASAPAFASMSTDINRRLLCRALAAFISLPLHFRALPADIFKRRQLLLAARL